MTKERFNPASDKLHEQLLGFFLDGWPPAMAMKVFKHLQRPTKDDISSLIWTARVWLEHRAIKDRAARGHEGEYERWLRDALSNAYPETRASTRELFNPGRIVVTRGADEQFSPGEQRRALDRHIQGDWGFVDAEDERANNNALLDGSQLLSVYNFGDRTLWIISDREISSGRRPTTTLLLPSEY